VNNWKVIPTIVLATVLIFGAGVFTGGMLVDYVKQNHPHSGMKHPAPVSPTNAPTTGSTAAFRPIRPPEVLSKDFLQRLDADLHLDKEERDTIQKIIGEGQNEMRKVLQDTRLEIREVLTQEQRDQFDELMKRPFHKPIFATNTPPAAVQPAANSKTP
jgi:uncharacterized membrane protein